MCDTQEFQNMESHVRFSKAFKLRTYIKMVSLINACESNIQLKKMKEQKERWGWRREKKRREGSDFLINLIALFYF